MYQVEAQNAHSFHLVSEVLFDHWQLLRFEPTPGIVVRYQTHQQ